MGFRLIPAFVKSVRAAWGTFSIVARQLFHEVSGAMFAMFSFYGVLAAWRGWHHGQRNWLLAVCMAYAALMAVFATTSFRKARRVR